MAYIPKKYGIGYKAFIRDPKTGKLYPPMVSNPDKAFTAIGQWIDAAKAPIIDKAEMDTEPNPKLITLWTLTESPFAGISSPPKKNK